MDVSKPVVASRWTGPPGWLHSLLTIGAGAAILYAASYPLGLLVPCCVGAAFPLVCWYVFRAVATLRWWRARSLAGRRRHWLFWAVLPVCTIVVIAALTAHWPFRVRFALSRVALEAEAQRLLETPAAQADIELREGWARFFRHRQVGAYTVQAVDVDYTRGHVYFSIGSVVRMGGLAYVGNSTEAPESGWREPYLPPEWGLFAYP
jgi:hypothetical protein